MAAQDQPLDSDRDSIQEISTFAGSRADSDVLTLEEISTLAAEGGNPAETLMNVVALIAKRFGADVCSAYLLEPDRANLVLAATIGLQPQCIGTLRMTLHEGLTGLVAEEVRPVAVGTAKNHPRFKFFMDAGEEAYESFLGVPLIDRGVLQGVLVVQTVEARIFSDEEVRCSCRLQHRWHRWSAKRALSPASSRRSRSDCGRSPVIYGGAGTLIPPTCSSILTPRAGDSSIKIRSPYWEKCLSLNSNVAPKSWCCTAVSTMPTAASRNILTRTAPGVRRMPAF